MNFPFHQKVNDNIINRTFYPDVDSEELVWHKDLTDRFVTIVESGGWQFQREDELPSKLENNQVIFIPKNSWHRVIKGETELIINILETH
jgi:mannose-6-phosphate isomerase-like protein (cupin superfamily)